MFKKLVSNLPFNPSLIGQVSFYSRRLKQEDSIRRLGFGFMALAVFIQVFAVLAPPQQSLAASSREIVPSNYPATRDGIYQAYDENPWIQAVYANFGIQRADMDKMYITNLDKKADREAGVRNLITAGRAPNGSAGETSTNITSSQYDAPIFKHGIDSTYPSKNLIPVMFCPRETCGAIKMIIIDCGNPVMDLNEPTPVPTVPAEGHLDGQTCTYLWGWAWNGPYERYVHIYIDRPAFGGAVKDRDYFEVVANQSRPDVHGARNEIATEVGYTWDGGPLNNDGKSHQVWVYVTDRGNNYALLRGGENASVNFNCPPPPAPVPTPTPAPTPVPVPTPAPTPAAACDALLTTTGSYQVKTPVDFYGYATAINGATLDRYDVNFGDGTTESFTNPLAIKHTYTKAGTFEAVLTVQTSLGARTAATCKKTLTITPEPVPPAPTAVCDLLQSTNDKYQVKTKVMFYGRATVTNGATISGYEVNFGDGKTETFTDRDAINHTYTKDGTYTVKLSVVTSLGKKTAATCEKQITITPLPIPCPHDANFPQTDAKCKPCIENPKIPESNPACVPVITLQKKVSNTTKKIDDFNNRTADANDSLVYTLRTTNVSSKITAKGYVIQEAVADLLDYADITDLNGGTLDNTTKVVSWPKEDIAAGSTVVRVLGIRVKSVIPATPVASTDSGTFDMKMVNMYGNTTVVYLPVPISKQVESAATTLPNTGPGTSAAIAAVLFIVVGYFFARARLLSKEIEIVRVEYASGGGF